MDNNVLLALVVYGGVVLAAFWVAMVIWAYRDMKARSRDPLARVFAALSVALLNVPGLFVYILLRPRESLSEAYERSLEEEALLQEIEEKPTCPGCGQRVQQNWQACPYCHTRLKKVCLQCHNLLDLNWELCPYCASDQTRYEPDARTVQASRHVQPLSPEPPTIPDKWLAASKPNPPESTEPPRYMEDDY